MQTADRYTGNTSVNAPIRVSKDSTATAETPEIPEGPRRRYLSNVMLAVLVGVTIRFEASNLHLSRCIVHRACLHI
ncbi:unnamed protein product [Lasius platythorax]|uniref:Uncharacterized protein n=1 Tax=Lasius platythorax TaxID=488582 RepID=A0AAV2P282_9HYME